MSRRNPNTRLVYTYFTSLACPAADFSGIFFLRIPSYMRSALLQTGISSDARRIGAVGGSTVMSADHRQHRPSLDQFSREVLSGVVDATVAVLLACRARARTGPVQQLATITTSFADPPRRCSRSSSVHIQSACLFCCVLCYYVLQFMWSAVLPQKSQ